jgi:threonine dehydratase
MQNPNAILEAHERIKNYIHKTPIIHSDSLNEMLGGHKIFFKAESLQKTGAFKVRGVLNHLLCLKEKNELPERVVAYSTGNHGIGLAYVAKILGISSRIYLPKYTSLIKQRAAEYYGAEVIYTENREEAEKLSFLDQKNGFYYLHPSDSDTTIAGAGTMCFEALLDLKHKPDAIFVSCGGGGLASGTYLAKELMSKESMLICTEPSSANDAFKSYKSGEIFRFKDSPNTIADGLKTLGLSKRTFEYIKKMDDFICVEEKEIFYWTAWLIHLLKIACEPSCSLNMAAVKSWLSTQEGSKNILVLISGGNIDPSLYREIWKEDYLLERP